MSRAATNRVGKSTLCLAKRFATLLAEAGSVLVDGNFGTAAMVISQLPGCRTKVRAPCGCGGRGGKGNLLIKALAFAASNFSFPEGTEVLTPEGPVAIETLREGDLVIARNEDTGVSGLFPVTAVMGRQAPEVLWLTLENTEGEVTRMGVTPTHPLFIAGSGWGEAGELVPGDAIRDRDLLPLTVLAIDVDAKPQMVHNLEIADAHTYFAGELEAWGHNTIWWKKGGGGRLQPYDTKTGQYVCKGLPAFLIKKAAGDFSSGFNNGWGGRFPERDGNLPKKCGQLAGALTKIFTKWGGG